MPPRNRHRYQPIISDAFADGEDASHPYKNLRSIEVPQSQAIPKHFVANSMDFSPPRSDNIWCRDLIVEMEGTVFTPSLEGMKNVKSEQGETLTKPFLDVCKLILPVIDKFRAAMALVKSDIGGNIARLETKYSSDLSKYEYLYSMVQEEVDAKTAEGSSSCTNGLLWLTRAMDFLVELFRNLLEHPDWSMSQACSDSYAKTEEMARLARQLQLFNCP